MSAPLIARILGLLFLIAGIAGLLPWTASAAPVDAPVITLDAFYRFIFGVFPSNAAYDALNILFGAGGLIAAITFGGAVFYCRVVTWVFVLLAILGALPFFATYTLFGAAPIYGWDIGLHAFVALVAAYGGYGRGAMKPEPTPQ